MLDNELIKNYEKSLNQKYNAICFDIDGTLTEINSTKIDSRVLPKLATLLKKHIPVVFITGRGETGLNDFVKDIAYDLKKKYGVTNKQLLRMYALTNDGARFFTTDKNSDVLFDVSKYISSPKQLEELEKLDEKINELLTNKKLNKYCKITYSKDLKDGTLINIRVAIKTNQKAIVELISNSINELIKNEKCDGLNLTLGIHEGTQILQIGTAQKSMAIEMAEKIIGIPKDSMLRVGDCGNKDGNDYSMLNCPQGFSVDKISGETNSCFPIINDDGKILKGVDATILLLNKAKLLPTICLEHATEKEYTKEYSRVEKAMSLGKNKTIIAFNKMINDKFEVIDGINALYDHSSGSVKIPMYEWIAIDDNNALKTFWSKQNENTLCYSMYDNENLLLRGPEVYYYFLANRLHDENTNVDITSKEMVLDWLYNNKTFYFEALQVINSITKINDLSDIKMVLGIIDNIRNYLLILLNQQIINRNPNKNELINLEKVNDNTLISQIYNNLIIVDMLMGNISFNLNNIINLKDIKTLLTNVIAITEEFTYIFHQSIEKENYSKDFRAYREIDNFAENFITCYLTMKKDDEIINKGICGLSYGGIELPIIMKSINQKIEEVSILKFNKGVTGYSKKQSLNLRFFNIYELGGLIQDGVDNKKYILLDDNLLTGKTMQIALTSLYDVGIDVDKVVVVRYPGVNRISQMFMPNHGAIDYRNFFDFIQGLYFSSPYSWKDPNSSNLYEDSLGVFDLNRRKILECIVKNGNYSKNSEVAYVKKR